MSAATATTLIEAILDDPPAELDRVWEEFDFIADFIVRAFVQYCFNQSGPVGARCRGMVAHRAPRARLTAP